MRDDERGYTFPSDRGHVNARQPLRKVGHLPMIIDIMWDGGWPTDHCNNDTRISTHLLPIRLSRNSLAPNHPFISAYRSRSIHTAFLHRSPARPPLSREYNLPDPVPGSTIREPHAHVAQGPRSLGAIQRGTSVGYGARHERVVPRHAAHETEEDRAPGHGREHGGRESC